MYMYIKDHFSYYMYVVFSGPFDLELIFASIFLSSNQFLHLCIYILQTSFIPCVHF